MARSSISAGFRAVSRTPGLVLAEIVWRWCFGIAAWVLIVLTFREYLASVRFTASDWLLVRSRQPILVAEAIAHALQGSGARLVKGSIIIALALVVFWIFAASVGRCATLKTLLQSPRRCRFTALLGLNFLRAALALAALIAYFGAAVLAGRLFPVDPTNTGQVLSTALIFLAVAVAVAFFWSMVNWFLSVAPIFALRDGRDTFGAISASVAFFRRRTAPVIGVTLLFDLFRVGLLIVATFAAIAPFTAVHGSTSLIRAVWLVLGITLVYFVLADFLYIARLAAYVSLAEEEEGTLIPIPGPPKMPAALVDSEPRDVGS